MSVMLYPCIFCVALLIYLFALFVLWITGVCSHYVVSLGYFAYYVVG